MKRLSCLFSILMLSIITAGNAFAGDCSVIGGTGADCQQTIKTKVVDVTQVKVQGEQSRVQSQIESWDGQHRKWQNWRGADIPVTTTMSEDVEEVIGNRFTTCQDVPHTYEQIMSPPITSSSACVTYYRYAGISSGICVKSTSCGFPCGCCWIIADVVDYYFPSYKINTSEQLYQSMYLDKAIVEEAIPFNEEIYGSAPAMAVDDMNKAAQAVGRSMAASVPGAAFSTEVSMAAAPDSASFTSALMQDSMSDLRHTSPSQRHVYTRNVFEPANQMTESVWYIPHVAKTHLFASDLPMAYWFSRFASMGSTVLPVKDQAFYSMVMGQYTCIKTNQISMKTPLYIAGLGGGNSAFPIQAMSTVPADTMDLCLKKIGQRYNLQSSGGGLMHISDRTWRGMAKDIDLFRAIYPDPGNIGITALHYSAQRHTFIENADKFLALRDKEFKAENMECRPINDMTKRNIDYFKVNKKKEMTGGENTVEIFPHYVGCWGFKGMDLDFWNGPCGGGVYTGNFDVLSGDPKSSPLRLH